MTTMFKKILIANRGEIACRVAATARRMGVRTVAVYSDADENAKHVAACDEAVRIGPAAPKESYLRSDRILQAALATGAEAIHPGYGFLSENEAFAEACAGAGVTFIGPPPSAIRAMGLKAASKRLMGAAGVPLVPGYHGADQSPDLLQAEADRIGYPVLIKASAGGGGKGMRMVESADAFAAALASCQREAISSFGDDAVLIERYVTRPRHIEIQVFGDTHGNIVSLFERDCSVQRRHQKVLEEAPAPGMSEERRREMGEAAIAAARAVGYVGAGTVEFIAEPVIGSAHTPGDLRFYFMEMNTRLQVEHPVTEAITGLDLVEWQLRVAAGEPLPLTQAQLTITGHAIEARISAENPDAGFLPATGTLDVYRLPPSLEFTCTSETFPVRIDGGVREDDAISPHYDPMIAKLIVWGRDRTQALARLDAALAQTHIVGVQTNVAFLRRVVQSRSFAGADLDTALIERERAALFDQPGLPSEAVAAGVIAHTLAGERALDDADPWSRRDGFRLAGPPRRTFDVAVSGERLAFVLEGAPRSRTLVIGDKRWPLRVADDASFEPRVDSNTEAAGRVGGGHAIVLGEHRFTLDAYASGTALTLFGERGHALVDLASDASGVADAHASAGRLTAPMPGKVIAFMVKAGDRVNAAQPLAVMEAMKMEHTIAAPRDGIVAELLYAVGDQVDEGGELLRLVAES